MLDGVGVYGGFAGTETALSQRDWEAAEDSVRQPENEADRWPADRFADALPGADLVVLTLALTEETVGADKAQFLKDGLEVEMLFDGDSPVIVELPNFVVLEITYCEPGVKGDTVSGGSKPATLETGAVVQVPLFIEEGERLKIDTRTGAKTINSDVLPATGRVAMVCPHGAGAKNFLPGSFDASAGILYVPLNEACMDVFPVPGGGQGALSSGVNWGIRPRPGSDGNFGRLQAIDLATGDNLWVVRQRAPQTSGVLATAGGLVFAASLDRVFRAYAARDGQVLWETRLNDVSSSSPVSYSVDGRQFIAVPVGQGGFHAASFAPLVPELESPPNRGAAVWVFALPD